MLSRMVRVAKHIVRDRHYEPEPRSGHWRKIRKEFLATQPVCQACGAKRFLNVHHIRPFHLHPDLELDLANLITLCVVNGCHLLLGHGDDFKAYNPDVAQDVATVRASDDPMAMLKEMTDALKAKRLYD